MKKYVFLFAVLGLPISFAHQHHQHSEKSLAASQGVFEDQDVKDRSLSDWVGQWQSIYPYLVNGDLDDVLAVKAQKGDKTLEEYRAYYLKGYQTNLTSVDIEENSMTFHAPNQVATCDYQYAGHEILTYESGKKGVRYLFTCTDEQSAAPKYVQFSDHIIAPEKAGHFHLYMGNDSHETLLLELKNWPTFYPKDLDKKGIVDEMIGHDSHHGAHQHGVANLNISIEDAHVEMALEGALANFLSFEYAPQSESELNEVSAMVGILQNADLLFVLSSDAGCTLDSQTLDSDVIHADLLKQKHGQMDPTHDDHGHDHHATHGNLSMNATWHCRTPEKLQQLKVGLFKYFPNLEQLNVQMITPTGQKAAELTAQSAMVTW